MLYSGRSADGSHLLVSCQLAMPDIHSCYDFTSYWGGV